MDITLGKDQERELTGSIRRYLEEAFGEEVGDLKAEGFLRFVLHEVGPHVYNRAIADARDHLEAQVADLENVCFAEERSWWAQGRGVTRRPGRG
ncbi:DUF2164 domain-containing protein [Mesoterricola sediminis]|uniref:DUF2164 domain-containing protein n=1 Tax=Mesoterricola sediminis TaxID=2927980 RepID=A0AA48H569_9BACT|nr:DUF2164 domain-containing protein [Mesoterricola sediminis]BDU77611.1 hypothetical protein METESE_25690 [Mesoterricola sediminis]